MRRTITFLSLGFAFLYFGAAIAVLANSRPQSKYQQLVARLKGGDTSINFSELRTAYANSPQYKRHTDSNLRKEMDSAVIEKDYEKAIKLGNKALDKYYLDIDAHQALFIAYWETHLREKAKFHHDIVKGLIGAILHSGDGKSEQSAIIVNSKEEEHIILQVMGLRLRQQSLINDKQHSYDEMVGMDPTTKRQVTLYFNIDRPTRVLEKDLKGELKNQDKGNGLRKDMVR